MGFIFFFRPTSAVTGGALCAPYGATPCSDLCFGCSAVPYSCSESSFPPPNQAASAARRILLSFDPNVCVQPRRTLCAVGCNALLDFISRLFMPCSYLKSWLRSRCGFCCRCGRSIDRADTHYFFNPTSRVRGRRTLCDVPCTRLFCSFFFIKSCAGFGAHKSG